MASLRNLFLQTLIASCLFFARPVEARTRQKTLLDVTDRIYLMNEEGGKPFDQVELRQFPYVMSYSKNVTLSGELCYAMDLGAFLKDCYEVRPKETTKWVVITPFDYVNTNDLLSNAPDYNIEGVVIQYDQAIEAAGYYQKPQLIAIANNQDGKQLQ